MNEKEENGMKMDGKERRERGKRRRRREDVIEN